MRIKSRVIYGFLIAIIAIMAIYSYWNTLASRQENEQVVTQLAHREVIKQSMPAPQFTLIDQDGVKRSLSDWRGRVVLLSFIYTRCPDVCPLLATQLLSVQESFRGRIPQKLVLVLVTLDPEHDEPAVLKEWTRAWKGEWLALTGGLEECRAVWRSYGVAVYKEPEGITVSHTAKTIIIDGDGLVRIEYYGIPNAEQLIRDIKDLLG